MYCVSSCAAWHKMVFYVHAYDLLQPFVRRQHFEIGDAFSQDLLFVRMIAIANFDNGRL